ncbi:MAG: LytTR family transcriptional regulator DNA-binding domain-containing protein [Bacilli bacterium]|nr:LytTR family transcriptional regulator DNA-binding domain-containing protein [Bacilli bacterium]
MINYIICDDNEEFAIKLRKIIENYMMNYDIDDNYHMFMDYGKEFKQKISKIEGYKVYVLDIETKNGSGLDASRYIREELDDWNSVIIMITAHNELKYEAFGNRLFLLDFINKFDDYEAKLKEDLERVMKNYDHREKCLTFEYNRVVKKVDFKHIVIIEKEKDSKKCIVKTTYGEYSVCKSLNSILKSLDDRFIKISRSCIINLEQVREYDSVENKITFKNGTVSYDISRDCKKKVFESVRVCK